MYKTLSTALEAFRSGGANRNRQIAKFCGVNYRTATEWPIKRQPKGEVLNRLWHLLDYCGFTVMAVDELNPITRYFGKLVAFQICSPVEVLSLLGLSATDSSYIWRVLQGDIVPLRIQSLEITIQDLESEYGELLQLAFDDISEYRNESITKAAVVELVEFVPEIEEQLPVLDREFEGISTVKVIAASHLAALEPLLRYLVGYSSESIADFRKIVGEDKFYIVLDLLKAMSSRKSHEFYKGV